MMKTISVMFGDELSDYNFGIDHPFGPKRYWAFKDEFERRKLHENCYLSAPAKASEQQLALFHDQAYIDKVKIMSVEGKGFLDCGDTPAIKGIFESASFVVGTTLKAIDLIMLQNSPNAFTPIGGLHHGTRSSAAGFCVFNDCCIAIEYLRKTYNIKRIAYIDIDAHHGDGVFYAFESDPNLLFIDLHQDGNTLYPGTGFLHETGKGLASGVKYNIPLAPHCEDAEAIRIWGSVEKFIDNFEPEFILLQCGADSLAGDPITQLDLTAKFHGYVAQQLNKLAIKHCPGKLLAMGGGGYNLENIAQAWNEVIISLKGKSD